MQIRHTREEDFDRIMEIYAHAREYMKEHGNPNQWGPTCWPPADLVKSDIREQKNYVCVEDDQIIGVFYYDYGHKIEPNYDTIDGKWIGPDDYGVVHRIAADGSRKGIGAFCIQWAIEQGGHLRIDTHGDNKTMQNLLTKLRFTQCGIIHVTEDHYPRLAYEIMK